MTTGNTSSAPGPDPGNVVEPEIRVLHLVWRLSKGGGIPLVVRALASGIRASRFRLDVATVRPAYAADDLDGLDAAAVLQPLGFTGALSRVDKARVAIAFLRRVRADGPAILHLHSGTAVYGALGALLGRGARVVLDVHAAPGNLQHGRRTEWIEGMLCRRLGWTLLVHSSSVRNETARAYRVPAAEIPLVPLGIDTRRFAEPTSSPVQWRQANNLPADAVVGLYVARLVPPKNVDLLIDAAAILRGTHAGVVFAVVGEGPDHSRLQERVRLAGLEDVVRFLGPRYGCDLVDAYHGSDVFVSSSDYESFGLALVEAMAAGKPTVATAVGGVDDVVEDGLTGLLVPRGDATALARAMAALAGDPGRRDELGRAALERARLRFDVATMVAGYERLYDRLMGAQIGVFVLKSPDFAAWHHDGEVSGRLPYGIDHLARSGLRIRWSDSTHRFPWASRPARRILRAFSKAGPPFLQTALNAHRISRAPVTLAMFESEGNFLAWLRRLGVPGLSATRLMVISCWLAELLGSFSHRRLAWYRRSYAEVDRLIFFSSNQFTIFEQLLEIPRERLRFVPFGVDEELFRPSGADDGFVLAVGRDRGRDWPTFLAAMERTGLPTKVLCRPSDLAGLAVPDNVEVLGYADQQTYRALLGRARVSVVATRDVAYPAGQSVTLESMATEKCCVVTGTEALGDYLDPGVNALVVPVADPEALAGSVSQAFDDELLRARIGAGGRRAVEDRFNARAMWAEVGREIRSLSREPGRRSSWTPRPPEAS